MRNLQTEKCGPVRDWQNGKRHPGQIIYGQNSGRNWEEMLSWGRSKNGQLKNQSSIMLGDYEESISLTVRTRNSKKPLGMPEWNWKHQWLPLCLARHARRARMGRPVARIMISNQNLRVAWKPVNPQDCVWKNLCQITMRTILQEEETVHYNITILYSYASSNVWTAHLTRHIFSLFHIDLHATCVAQGSSRKFGVRTSRVMCHPHLLTCLFWPSTTSPLSSLCCPSSLLSSCLSSWPSTSSSTMWWTNSLCTPANEDFETLAEYDTLTGCEPNDYHISEATEPYIQESSVENGSQNDLEYDDVTIGKALSSPLFTQEREDDASRRRAYHSQDEGLSSSQSSSVGHKRTRRPVVKPLDS